MSSFCTNWRVAYGMVFISSWLGWSCGSIESVQTEKPDPDPTQNESVEDGDASTSVFLFATDYVSSGQLLVGQANKLTNTNVANLGSSAVLRAFAGRLYLLHDGFSVGSSDNVQVIDPEDNFRTLTQFSTGNGTNPKDIVVDGDLAYISLYSPELSQGSDYGDVIVMNLQTGGVVFNFDLSPYLAADGAQTARADQMLQVGRRLYVCVQDLEGETFGQNAAGKLVVINLDTLEIERVVVLKGRNPFMITYSEEAGRIFIAHLAPFDYAIGNFDTSLPYGGVEILPVGDLANSTLIHDEDLDGYVERVLAHDGWVYIVSSTLDPKSFQFSSTILRMDAAASTADAAEIFFEGSSDIRALAVDGEDRLWISRRKIISGTGQAGEPLLDVIDPSTGALIGASLTPIVPVVSIVSAP